jgi:hypothetical protein
VATVREARRRTIETYDASCTRTCHIAGESRSIVLCVSAGPTSSEQPAASIQRAFSQQPVRDQSEARQTPASSQPEARQRPPDREPSTRQLLGRGLRKLRRLGPFPFGQLEGGRETAAVVRRRHDAEGMSRRRATTATTTTTAAAAAAAFTTYTSRAGAACGALAVLSLAVSSGSATRSAAAAAAGRRTLTVGVRGAVSGRDAPWRAAAGRPTSPAAAVGAAAACGRTDQL